MPADWVAVPRSLIDDLDDAALGAAVRTLADDKLDGLAPNDWVGTDRDPWFAEFWAAYPRRTGKGQARRAWRTAMIGTRGPRANARRVIRAAEALARDPNLPPAHFIPHPATWLNGERWEDGPLPEREPDRTASYGVDL